MAEEQRWYVIHTYSGYEAMVKDSLEKLIENNIKFTIIPGANAGLSALVLSGFDATKFAFFGFFSKKS